MQNLPPEEVELYGKEALPFTTETSLQVIPVEPVPSDAEYSRQLCRHLEQGNILLLKHTPFLPEEQEATFLRGQKQSESGSHKNIAYKPDQKRITGAKTLPPEQARRLHAVLSRYSENAIDFLRTLLPDYARSWQVDYASFRPIEEEGRRLAARHRNDLLHLDAFPTRPTHGGRILRAFTNLHPFRERLWATAPPFPEIAERYALAAGLRQVTGPIASAQRWLGHIGRHVGFPVPDRSPYDAFMLRFHHYLKNSPDFQQQGRCQITAFPPGATWISFTDQIAHAVLSGQYALEQTCIVPYTAMLLPEKAPLAILERLAGRPLTTQRNG